MSKTKEAVAVVMWLCLAVLMTAALWYGAITKFDDRIDGDHLSLIFSVLCFVNAVGCTLGLLFVALVAAVAVWCAVSPADPPR